MKNITDYFKMIVTAVTCFVMSLMPEKTTSAGRNNNADGNTSAEKNNTKKNLFVGLFIWMENIGVRLLETSPRVKLINAYIIKDMESKKKRLSTESNSKEDRHKNKIIYWNEPRIQKRINKFAYFHTG